MDIREVRRLEERCMFGGMEGRERESFETMLWDMVFSEIKSLGIEVEEDLASHEGMLIDGLKEKLYKVEQDIKAHAENEKSDHSKCVVLFDCLEHFIVYWCKKQ